MKALSKAVVGRINIYRSTARNEICRPMKTPSSALFIIHLFYPQSSLFFMLFFFTGIFVGFFIFNQPGAVDSRDLIKECRTPNSCYIFVNQSLPWLEAMNVCRGFSGRGFSIAGPAENEWMMSRMRNLQFQSSYLDMKYSNNDRSFYSSDMLAQLQHNIPPAIEVIFTNKKNNIRRKRSLKPLKRQIVKTSIIFQYKHGQDKWKRKKEFDYREKFIESHRKMLESKLINYKVIVLKRSKKVLNIKFKILTEWEKRIEWLKKQNWEAWLKTIDDIDCNLWIQRVKKIINVIEAGKIEQVDYIWESWWKQILIWYKEWVHQYSKKQIDMIWRWKRFVAWLIKNDWETVFDKIEGIDKKLWTSKIKRLIMLIQQRKYSEICDKDWTDWKAKIESWVDLIKNNQKSIFDNDSKRITIEEWKKRVDWLQKNHVLTFLKYGQVIKDNREELMTQIKNIMNWADNNDVVKLSNPVLLKFWTRFHEDIQNEITLEKISDGLIRQYLEWINRDHWLRVNNIDLCLNLSGGEQDRKEYQKWQSILNVRDFSQENNEVLGNIYNNLKILVDKQHLQAQRELNAVPVSRKKRSYNNQYDTRRFYPGTLDIEDVIMELAMLAGEHSSLKHFILERFFNLHYLAVKLTDSHLEPHRILLKKLIVDQIERLKNIGLPLKFWDILSAAKLGGISIKVTHPGDCLIVGNNDEHRYTWQFSNCTMPRQFVCHIRG